MDHSRIKAKGKEAWPQMTFRWEAEGAGGGSGLSKAELDKKLGDRSHDIN